MIRRILIILAVTALAAGLFGCGGGNSTSDTPTGVNPGVVSRVELMATSYVNQSNGYCYLKTKVLDGNGTPVQNRQVVWTNLSTIGVLDTTTSTTNESGIATATLYSTTWGFATVQSEVNADNTGTEKIRDRKTVYFTPFDMAWPSTGGGTTIDLAALTLDVDSNDNGVYNEPSDFILFDPPGKTDAIIRATVTDTLGAPLLNSAVTFGADSPEVTFPLGSDPKAPIVHTNAAGQASVLARVSPSILRNTESTVNITAAADNNTFNVLTLFLKPVTVDTVTVAANPSTVASAGTSAISATVKTTAGNPVPQNTIVNFTTSAGSIIPFAATDAAGVATAQLTAPVVTTSQNVTVTASVGGKSGSKTVTVTAASVPLNVIPDTQTMPLPILVGQTARYTIIGGTPPYSVFSDNAAVARGSITGSTMTAMIASVPTGATTVTFSIFDSVGAKKDVTLKLNIVGGGGGTGSMLVQPSSATVAGIQNPDTSAADNLTFAITGGVTPFNCISNNTAIITSPGAVNNTTSSFTVDPTSVAVSTVVTITCTDINNLVASTVITVTPQPFSITTDVTNVIGISNPDAQPSDNVTVTVAGGTGPYIVQSSNPALTPPGIWSSTTPPIIPLPGSFTFDANSVGQNTVVTLTAFDNTGATATKNITIFPQFNSANPVISLNKSQVVGLTNPDASTADDITFTVTGGTPPYAISLGLTCPTAFNPAAPFLMARQWTLAVSGATQLVDPTSPTAIENCTLTVTDSNSNIASITFTVNP